MSKYREYLRRNKPSLQSENLDAYGTPQNSTQTEEEEEEADQIAFERFKKRSSGGEAIRYRTDWYLGPEKSPTTKEDGQEDPILWISSRNKPTSIPRCGRCNSERRFEFQVMPQLLNDLLIKRRRMPNSGEKSPENKEEDEDEDHLDWGTLLVYSCPRSCPVEEDQDSSSSEGPVSSNYVQEFIYHQPVA